MPLALCEAETVTALPLGLHALDLPLFLLLLTLLPEILCGRGGQKDWNGAFVTFFFRTSTLCLDSKLLLDMTLVQTWICYFWLVDSCCFSGLETSNTRVH